MNRPQEAEKLTQDERALLEHFRQTTQAKRPLVLAVAADYCRVFPAEAPKLRLVPAK